jgi:hypothetical protein
VFTSWLTTWDAINQAATSTRIAYTFYPQKWNKWKRCDERKADIIVVVFGFYYSFVDTTAIRRIAETA